MLKAVKNYHYNPEQKALQQVICLHSEGLKDFVLRGKFLTRRDPILSQINPTHGTEDCNNGPSKRKHIAPNATTYLSIVDQGLLVIEASLSHSVIHTTLGRTLLDE
jgi:hypothetical protein